MATFIHRFSFRILGPAINCTSLGAINSSAIILMDVRTGCHLGVVATSPAGFCYTGCRKFPTSANFISTFGSDDPFGTCAVVDGIHDNS